MCGIVGLWHLDGQPIESVQINLFTDSLLHRGPDGKGVFLDSDFQLGLGHRRLSILDLDKRSNQPMICANARYHLVFNGEIYNFLEVKKELEGLGYHFKTKSDTEVLLNSFIEWGEECQFKFNGMWAFAIWDKAMRKLFISRDRFGVKPLYYWFNGKKFAFASEQKAFLALKDYPYDFDYGVLSNSICNWALLEGSDRSILKDVFRLAPGHSLSIKLGSHLKIKRWWNTLDYLDEISEETPQEELLERFTILFEDATRIRMRSDVSLGMALSGGLDSSSVACMMRHVANKDLGIKNRQSKNWQNAFCASFPGNPQDESEYAKEIIEATSCKGNFLIANPSDAISNLESVVYSIEDICGFGIDAWLLYQSMKKNGVSVSLDGHGGDELLAGYNHYPNVMMKDWFRLGKFRPSIGQLNTIYTDMTPTQYNLPPFRQRLGIRPREYISRKHNCLNQEPTPFYFNRYSQDKYRLEDKENLFHSLYFDFHFGSLPTILRNFDRVSMAHGVEIRSPLLDWRLVCLGFSLPSSSKISNSGTKHILRESMVGLMPENVRTRKKKLGFISPIDHWLSNGAKSKFQEILNDNSFANSNFIDVKKTKAQFEKMCRTNEFSNAESIWVCVNAFLLNKIFTNKRNLFSSFPN